MLHPIFRFGLPIGTAFVICGLHEIVTLLTSALAIIFFTLDITGIHLIDTEIECAMLPLLEEHEQMIHPHELKENPSISSVEHLITALISCTAILLFWIGFLLKGGKPCLLAWILLSAMTLVFDIRYFVTANDHLIESETESEDNQLSAFSQYIWPSIQILITTARFLYMVVLGGLYLWDSRSERDIDYEDVKPVGIGLIHLIKYYAENLHLGLLVLATAPLLDALLYICSVTPGSMSTSEFLEALMFFFLIEAVPYFLLITCVKLCTIKWLEYWRATFLAICCLWGLVVMVGIFVPIVTCSHSYHVNYYNLNNNLGLIYILFYKCLLHRFSLYYVRKYRNPVAVEMTDIRAASNDVTYEPNVPFANSYDI